MQEKVTHVTNTQNFEPLPTDKLQWSRNFTFRGPRFTLRCEALYDSGSPSLDRSKIEDIACCKPPFFYVGDGADRVHLPGENLLLSTGNTWGRQAALTPADVIAAASPSMGLREIIDSASARLYDICKKERCFEPGKIGGTAGVILKHEEKYLHWAAWGDCLVMAKTSEPNSKLIVSRNQVAANDADHAAIVREIMGRAKSEQFPDRETLTEEELRKLRNERLWPQFAPYICRTRNQRVNNIKDPRGYGSLNGDPRIHDFVQYGKVQISKLEQFLLCTDGYPHIDSVSRQVVDPEALLNIVGRDGLRAGLLAARKAAYPDRMTAHITFAEAGAISIIPSRTLPFASCKMPRSRKLKNPI